MPRQSSSIFAVSGPEIPAQSRPPSSIPARIFASCLTSILVAVHYTNFGPLIPTLITDIHINSGQAGLFSTFLFLGLAVMYIPAGILCVLLTQAGYLTGSAKSPV